MKKARIILTSLVLGLALTGVIVAKANENKRRTQLTVYFLKSDGINFGSITGDAAYFDAKGTSTQAALIDQGNTARLLYTSQSTTNADAKFIWP